MEGANSWSREEDKAFENAIAMHLIKEITEEQWGKIASMVPSKDIEQVKKHYEVLVEDVNAIETGQVPIPCYSGEEPLTASLLSKGSPGSPTPDKKLHSGAGNGFPGMIRETSCGGHGAKGGSRSEQERKKGIPWTEEEHRLFLLGLDKFGKGDWRSISRNFVISRTPTQVASHAQKYFIRLNSMNRDRRRSSIHDITSINNQTPPVTGHQQAGANAQPVAAMGPTATKHKPVHGIGMYGAPPYGHPVAAAPPGHIGGSAVGTPVMLPHHHHHHHHPPPYVVPVAAYPMPPPPPTMH